MGWVSKELSELSRAFVAACGPGSVVLDIGAAYGPSSLEALRAGAHVIANDLDAGHLAELARRAEELGPEARSRLEPRPGHFPQELACAEGTLAAVHAANVLHFLTRRQLGRGLRDLARWLRPGGRVYLQAVSPYQQPFAAFIPEFERRRAEGQAWPGWVEKISDWSGHGQLSQMPRSIHLLDDLALRQALEEAGLRVEEIGMRRLRGVSPSLYLDGRESVAAVAVKPV